MSAKKINQPVNTFVKGLITEASPLTFPENASLDEVNFRLLRDGTRQRRLGMQHICREALPFTRLEFEKYYAKVYKWEQPKGSSQAVIGVVQVGTLIYFVDLTIQPKPSYSAADLIWYNDPIPLLNGGNAVDVSAKISGTSPIEFATLQGYLLLVNAEQPNPYIAWYNDVNDEVHWGTAEILVRDTWGVDDTLLDDYRPTDLSDKHKYNLRNQGWNDDIITTCGTDILDCFFSSFGKYPSNSDSWGAGRTADLTSADVYKFDPELAKRNSTAISTAAKGHYIMSTFFRGRDRHNLTGVTTDTDIDESFFSTIEAYAGRAWFSGVKGKVVYGDIKSPNYNNAVFFSQVMETPYNLVRCYQQADPTSYEFNELVDTDGGIIFIPECSFITKIKHIKSSMWVFGDNGVWEIRGPDGTGFTATSFEVRKINAIGLSSKDSVVIANGTIFYWSYSGIYAILPNPNVDGLYDTINVTQSTIQTRYDDFDTFTKTSAKGIYDPYNNKIRWLYNSSKLEPNSSKLESGTGEIVDYHVLAECNYQPFWLTVEGDNLTYTKYLLFTKKDAATPDSTTSYVYPLSFPSTWETNPWSSVYDSDPSAPKIKQLTNAQVIAHATVVPPIYPIIAHAAVNVSYGTGSQKDDIYYFYCNNVTSSLIAQKLLWEGSSNTVSVVGTPVVTNTTCRSYEQCMAAEKLSDTKFIVAYHNTNLKASTQIINSNLTYGTSLDTTNNVYANSSDQYLSLVVLSSSKAALLYWDNVFSGCTIDLLSISGNTITKSNSTTYPNTTQMPTGTTTFRRQRGIAISSSKFLVCGFLTNATLGYTDILSCFIVSVSGTTVTSTTILNLPTELGGSFSRVQPVEMGYNINKYTLIYVNKDYNMRYIHLDTTGTTPVLLDSGDWSYEGAGERIVSAHIPASVAVGKNGIATAFRGGGSLGEGGVAVYKGEIPT